MHLAFLLGGILICTYMRHHRETQENFWRWWVCLLRWLWWWYNEKWSCSRMCDSLWSHGLVSRLPCLWHFPGMRVVEWVAIPFSRGSSLPGYRTQVSCITSRQTLYPLSHQGSPMISWVYAYGKIIVLCIDIPHLIELCFIVKTVLFFYKLKVSENSALSKSIGTIFPTAFAHFVSLVSHFGNACNISNFFIIGIFFMVICNHWPLILLLPLTEGFRWWLAFF